MEKRIHCVYVLALSFFGAESILSPKLLFFSYLVDASFYDQDLVILAESLIVFSLGIKN